MKVNIYEDLSVIVKRGQKTFLIIKILFFIVVLFFWKIQVLDYKGYWEQSENNRIRERVLSSQRGLIRDRENRILADNTASFKASIIRENSKDLEKSYEKISPLLSLDAELIKERIKKYQNFPAFWPIVVKENLTEEEVARVESRRAECPELIIQAEAKRYYPYKSLAAHVIGYLQEVSPEDMKSDMYEARKIRDLVGKTGVEKEYDSLLAGSDGIALEIVDSLGRKIDELSRQEPAKGQDLFLTLDFDLQSKAEELLGKREGAIVMLHVPSGEILAMASYPTFDPNKFISRFTPEEWMGLVENSGHPLENRAIRGLYSPGSVFKLTMALAALHSGFFTKESSFFCGGRIFLYRRPFSCWLEGGHGEVDFTNALKHSCNVYFYQVGKRMEIEKISYYAKLLGFGAKTEIDLPGEKAGLFPDPEWKRETRNTNWFPGETISVSIGQGPITVTPLQIAYHTTLFANRGKKVRPHLILSDSKEIFSLSENIDPFYFEDVIEGMWKAVNEQGTARAARVEGFDVCGKTGSTQVVSSEAAERLAKRGSEIKTHSWFTGFAPRAIPEITVTVIVEFGGMGGSTAAPIARKLFQLYWEKHGKL